MLRSRMALLTAIGLAFSVRAASAQPRCEGYTSAKGDCVSELAAAAARRQAVIFSEPKISETAYPVLPSSDSSYRYPNQLISIPNSGMTPIGKAQAPGG